MNFKIFTLGKGKLMDQDLFDKLIDQNVIDESMKLMTKYGFLTQNKVINVSSIKSRLEEYAATYLLDRQEGNWSYTYTKKQCAKICIAPKFSSDREGFSELMEDIIDRYRGRIKKELEKFYY